jgi:hypothetical protein
MFQILIFKIFNNRLFVRVINEYTSTPTKGSSDEQAINDNAFTLIFAFDEIVALGIVFASLVIIFI